MFASTLISNLAKLSYIIFKCNAPYGSFSAVADMTLPNNDSVARPIVAELERPHPWFRKFYRGTIGEASTRCESITA